MTWKIACWMANIFISKELSLIEISANCRKVEISRPAVWNSAKFHDEDFLLSPTLLSEFYWNASSTRVLCPFHVQADNTARLRRAVQQGHLGTVQRFLRAEEATSKRWQEQSIAVAVVFPTWIAAVFCFFVANLVQAEFLNIISAPDSNLMSLALQSKRRLEMMNLLIQGHHSSRLHVSKRPILFCQFLLFLLNKTVCFVIVNSCCSICL